MEQGEQAVIGLTGEGLADARPFVTPVRAALFVLGAILGGFALSLILGTAPAHAADGDGAPAPDGGLLGTVTSMVTPTTTTPTPATTVAAATTVIRAAAPQLQPAVHKTGDTVAVVVALTAPVVRPIVTTVSTTLSVVQQSAAPLHAVLWTAPAASDGAAIRAGSVDVIAAGAASGTASATVSPVSSGDGRGTLPSPIPASSTGAPVAALGALFLALALVLLAARRRIADDALPPSPVFETDTSPA